MSAFSNFAQSLWRCGNPNNLADLGNFWDVRNNFWNLATFLRQSYLQYCRTCYIGWRKGCAPPALQYTQHTTHTHTHCQSLMDNRLRAGWVRDMGKKKHSSQSRFSVGRGIAECSLSSVCVCELKCPERNLTPAHLRVARPLKKRERKCELQRKTFARKLTTLFQTGKKRKEEKKKMTVTVDVPWLHYPLYNEQDKGVAGKKG